MNNGNGNGLEALYEKEKALRARIAEARSVQQKREAQFGKRLAEIIGGALIEADNNGDLPPEIKTTIKAIILAGGIEDRAKRMLQAGGWLREGGSL